MPIRFIDSPLRLAFFSCCRIRERNHQKACRNEEAIEELRRDLYPFVFIFEVTSV